ncbi:MAG: hypothetical protein RJQ08_14285 [Salinisphaeraceae bacterium]
MLRNLAKFTAGSALAVAVAAAAQNVGVGGDAAYVQQPMTVLDTDNDTKIDFGEFKMGFDAQRFFSDWDRNDNGRIEEDEYVTAHFSLIDLDRDGVITSNEWESSGRFWLEDDYPVGFSHWDIDGDERINRDEFACRLETKTVFQRWDADSSDSLNEKEVMAGIHGSWDADDDGVIDQQEQQRDAVAETAD